MENWIHARIEGNINREMKIPRKNKKMLEIKIIVTEMKNDFDGLINGLHTWLRKKIVNLKQYHWKFSKLKKKEKRENRISKNRGIYFLKV